MRGDDHVIELMVLDEGVARMHQLDPCGDRHRATDYPSDYGERQIKGADVLVVGGTQPAREEARNMAVTICLVAMKVTDMGVPLVSHPSLPRCQLLLAGAALAASVASGAAARRTGSLPLSCRANFFLASTSQC